MRLTFFSALDDQRKTGFWLACGPVEADISADTPELLPTDVASSQALHPDARMHLEEEADLPHFSNAQLLLTLQMELKA